MRPQRRRALTAGLLGGGAAGLLLFGPQLVNAAEPLADVITQAPPTTEPTDDAAATDDAATDDTTVATDPATDDEVTAEQGTSRREERLQEALQPLVDDGTLTQEQADAVIDALQSAAPSQIVLEGPMHGGGPGGPGFPGGPGIPGGHGEFEIFAEGPGIDIHVALPMNPATADVVANAIGIDLADLLTQLTDGSTVAEIATANGVDPQAVIDAVVQDVSERLTAAVESGRLTQEEADERLANTTERITNWVNGTASSEEASEAPATDPAPTEATTETTTSA